MLIGSIGKSLVANARSVPPLLDPLVFRTQALYNNSESELIFCEKYFHSITLGCQLVMRLYEKL